MDSLNNRIKKMLIDKGMTQKQLAEKCGWTSSNITNKFSRETWNFRDLQKIANALDMPIVISIVPEHDNE